MYRYSLTSMRHIQIISRLALWSFFKTKYKFSLISACRDCDDYITNNIIPKVYWRQEDLKTLIRNFYSVRIKEVTCGADYT